jgi:hypothetical protein
VNAKETIRFAAIFLATVGGLYGFGSVAFSGGPGDRFDVGSILFGALFSAPLFFIAHSCLRRRFDRVVVLLAFFAAALLGAVLFTAPHWLGLDSFFAPHHPTASTPLRDLPYVLGLLIYSLLCLFGPIWGATSFFRALLRFASRYIHSPTPNSRNA